MVWSGVGAGLSAGVWCGAGLSGVVRCWSLVKWCGPVWEPA